MYMLNKVRVFDNDHIDYEIVDYDISNPHTLAVRTVRGDELSKYEENGDFIVKDGMLISTADNVVGGLCSNFEVKFEGGVYADLLKLVEADAFYIPDNDIAYLGEGDVSQYPVRNTRVSASSMFVGFSYFSDEQMFTKTIVKAVGDELVFEPFHVAVVKGANVGIQSLSLVKTIELWGKTFDIFRYDIKGGIVPEVNGLEYLPYPVLNHLQYNSDVWKTVLTYFGDLKEAESVTYTPYAKKESKAKVISKSVNVKGSMKCSPRIQRNALLNAYFGRTLDMNNVNQLDKAALGVIGVIDDLNDPGVRLTYELEVKKLKVSYDLVLMQLRALAFERDFLFRDNALSIHCRGGGGGDLYYSVFTAQRASGGKNE